MINLCDPIDSLAAVNKIPIVDSTVMAKFSFRDIQIASDTLQPTDRESQEVTLDQIDAAFRESTMGQSQQTLSQLRHAIECVDAIKESTQ
ncbi:MAG: hypothetical protein KZQ66_15705 [Candidatus Thiodiazotropha sp. (ex Lucinoma aequizonata)]|nr:hypothetical protein [Candidatus Thiodiazotropha sp. (ex Lucinoma aequizonata)]MCU7895313.1 hypothetical protein [Candidatus Thiodiazotropha sp. (ex Lucinoma aequizonata)]MCU7900418.1 hypothetical protein [Candidatus Thiodiazotropha sp. (ex Lucinoma aequizonata)]MCU7903255.1 hypothetical protein [Candidatus Thiodiazotropha sp. (ex Lucinoma aequizonata)]MCU7909422.1 hypothetical protein [Candidatus Thiodiazotropha sp. (ex Lucinoma aequizonata)]